VADRGDAAELVRLRSALEDQTQHLAELARLPGVVDSMRMHLERLRQETGPTRHAILELTRAVSELNCTLKERRNGAG
jgi:hypothetical protein